MRQVFKKMKTTPPPPCPFDPIRPSELVRDDAYYMALAFNEAIKGWKANEVPIGAILVFQDQVIARAWNQVEMLNDPTAHAEMLTITQAARHIGDWRLNGATLYVTKEPCPMCAGASIMARLDRVIYAVSDPKMGCLGGATALHDLPRLNHRVSIIAGPREAECKEMLQAYFQRKRQTG